MTVRAPIAVEVRVTGRVQGVWFRGWVREQALRLGLTGWVRNRPDRSVSALFVGPEAAVDAMIALCHRGPPSARVVEVQTWPAALPQDLAEFRVER